MDVALGAHRRAAVGFLRLAFVFVVFVTGVVVVVCVLVDFWFMNVSNLF